MLTQLSKLGIRSVDMIVDIILDVIVCHVIDIPMDDKDFLAMYASAQKNTPLATTLKQVMR
ncbi:MAG: hypothetical protein HYR68_05585 [Burkholderiales bacterium]|nr:hypothetical protein [Burkholderiales bacterium]MBI3728246.1 hypothetical protein [Burkholderiales bacterium]